MKLSDKRKIDLETVMYFVPSLFDKKKITERDIEMFFENSEKGMHKDLLNTGEFGIPNCTDGFWALTEGKRWRGVHMQLYEDGVLSGDMPYYVILGGNDKCIKRKWYQFWKSKYTFQHNPPPRSVVDFMKKEMFKGIDAEVIERCYQKILKL